METSIVVQSETIAETVIGCLPPPCKTLVFMDLETSGLPCHHNARVTELSFLSVERDTFLNSPFKMPRVTNRLNLCVYPWRLIDTIATEKTGLDNYGLEHQGKFDLDVFNILSSFLNRLAGPVCLIAHNGNRFDFPILRAEIDKLDQSLPVGLKCADSLPIFRNLQQETIRSPPTEITMIPAAAANPFQASNETTPRKQEPLRWPTATRNNGRHRQPQHLICKKTLPFSARKTLPKFDLESVYERCYGQRPVVAHSAEADVETLLLAAIATPAAFLKAVDADCVPFGMIHKCW